MNGPQIIACLIIALFVGFIAHLGDEGHDGPDHGLKVGIAVFFAGIIITAVCG